LRLYAGRRRFRIVVELTKASIWLVVLCYGVAVWQHPSDRLEPVVKAAWLTGLFAYVVHVLLAFATFYEWSWATAWQATADDAEALTGVRAGWGLWLNIAFGIVWALLAWCLFGQTEEGTNSGRVWMSQQVKLVLHAFLLFMVIQGGVIFAPPAARCFTVTVLVCVGARALVCLRRDSASPR